MNRNRITPLRAIAFVCVLAAIALLMLSAQGRREKRSEQIEAQKTRELENQTAERIALIAKQEREAADKAGAERATQLAAEEHARYLARYLNSGSTRRSGAKVIALVVASESGTANSAVNDALLSRFKSADAQIVPSFFKPAFVSDGLFDTAFAGSSDLFDKLELSKSLDGLLLAREKVQYAANPSLENVITASMQFEVAMVPIGSHMQSGTWTFTANGAGFHQAEARQQAEERIIKQIATDTKMSAN